MAAASLMRRIEPRSLVVGTTLVIGSACPLSAVTARLELLVALRIVQGFSGGVLLVGGQAFLFLAYPRSRQPTLQALFAMAAVVAPATIAPAFQGWLLDSRSWTWIFFCTAPLALAAAGILLFADGPAPARPERSEEHTSELQSLMRISYAVFCLKKTTTHSN